MNIFFLHPKAKKCVKYYVDRHVVKMILETFQLLCTAIWLCGDDECKEQDLVKKTHENHPSAKWARESRANWLWLQELGMELCKEYTFRYEKRHKYEDPITSLTCPTLPEKPFTEPTQAMPDCFKHESSKTAYRNYYLYGKTHLHCWKTRHAWKNRKPPKFILKVFPEYEDFDYTVISHHRNKEIKSQKWYRDDVLCIKRVWQDKTKVLKLQKWYNPKRKRKWTFLNT